MIVPSREGPMSKTEFAIHRLRLAELEQELREFERAHKRATGEELSSEEFFARFCRGEFDTLFGIKWAGAWRLYRDAAAAGES
jgi:hypothetical protein